jgi:hypothetical protein
MEERNIMPAFNLYCNDKKLAPISEIELPDDCKTVNSSNKEFNATIELKNNPQKKYKVDSLKVNATFSDGQKRSVTFQCLKATVQQSRKYRRYMHYLENKKIAKKHGLTFQKFLRIQGEFIFKLLQFMKFEVDKNV